MTEINLRFEAILAKLPEVVEYIRVYWVTPFVQSGTWRVAADECKRVMVEEGFKYVGRGVFIPEFDQFVKYVATLHGFGEEAA